MNIGDDDDDEQRLIVVEAFWNDMEQVVTPENVNAIPADWKPKSLTNRQRTTLVRHITDLSWRDESCGFLFYLCMGPNELLALVPRFVKKWSHSLQWQYKFTQVNQGVERFARRSWLAHELCTNPTFALLAFENGCPVHNDYFYHLCLYISEHSFGPDNMKYRENYTTLLKWILDRSLDNYKGYPGAEFSLWILDLWNIYYWRRKQCRRIAMIVFASMKHFSKDLASVTARKIWATQNSSKWDLAK